MLRGDLIVERSPEARTTSVGLEPKVSIAVIGRSLGTPTPDILELTRGSGNEDTLTGYKSPLRSIEKLTQTLTFTGSGETVKFEFFPGVHFVVKGDSEILDHRYFLGEKYSSFALNFANPPALAVPRIVSAVAVEDSGSTLPSGTYYYAITALDLNSNESLPSTVIEIEVPSGCSVNLVWSRVSYSSGYHVYRGTSPNNLRRLNITNLSNSGPNVTSFKDDGSYSPGTESPPTTSVAKQKPKSGSTYILDYSYGKITPNEPKLYTSLDDVARDFGRGSELYNIARLVLSPTFNAAPSVVLVAVPFNPSLGDYLAALDSLSTRDDVMFVTGTLNDDLFFSALYDHCSSLSDPRTGQKERYAIFGGYNGIDVSNVKSKVASFHAKSDKGKRGIFIYPDGGKISVSTWVNPDGTVLTDYCPVDVNGRDITHIIFGISAIARYLGLNDLTEPLTEKDIRGFTFKNVPDTDETLKSLRDFGVMVVVNSSGTPVVERSINMSLPYTSLEDAELSICVWEDWMKGDIRRRLRKFRGKKMLGSVLAAAKDTIRDALGYYVQAPRQWITAFDEKSIVVRNDEIEKDKLVGYFEYMPVYPINWIYITYGFRFVQIIV